MSDDKGERIVRPVYLEPGENMVGFAEGGRVLTATDKKGTVVLWVESPVGESKLTRRRVLVVEQKQPAAVPDGATFIAMSCSRGLWYAVYVCGREDGD